MACGMGEKVKQKDLVYNHGPGAEGAFGVDKEPEPQSPSTPRL